MQSSFADSIPFAYSPQFGFKYIHEEDSQGVYEGTVLQFNSALGYSGYGKLIFKEENQYSRPKGSFYIGEFKNGSPEGKGTLYNQNGNKVYSGQFKEGLFDGYGVIYNEDPISESEGNFSNSLQDFSQVFHHKKWRTLQGIFEYDAPKPQLSVLTLNNKTKIKNGVNTIHFIPCMLTRVLFNQHIYVEGLTSPLNTHITEANQISYGMRTMIRQNYYPLRFQDVDQNGSSQNANSRGFYENRLIYRGGFQNYEYHGSGTEFNLNQPVNANFIPTDNLLYIFNNNLWSQFDGTFYHDFWDIQKPGRLVLLNGIVLTAQHAGIFSQGLQGIVQITHQDHNVIRVRYKNLQQI